MLIPSPLDEDKWTTSVAFLSDSRRVVTAGEKAVLVWSVETGEKLAALEGHTETTTCVATSPDGRQIASGSSPDFSPWGCGVALVRGVVVVGWPWGRLLVERGGWGDGWGWVSSGLARGARSSEERLGAAKSFAGRWWLQDEGPARAA
jgi:hypothetical protein